MMVYPDNFESKIKFDKIRELIKGRCLSSMGRELTEGMAFSAEAGIIRQALSETQEFMDILSAGENFPGGHFQDARPFLQKIRVEGLFLEVAEMVALKNSLESLAAIVRFFKGKEGRYPLLSQRAEGIKLFPYIQQRLDAIVSKHGTVKDSASPELNDIRHRLLRKQTGISKRMQSLLQQAQAEGWAEKDSAIAIRDGRMVIPVPSAYKRKINGIVHDVPETEERPELLWYGARHPLLWLSLKGSGKELVPLDIEINEDQRIILISGPNAGGKSVCLQTVGLLQYMFQCGLPVPVKESSKFGIFNKILIDIGDEQSIENDLSTYSSHLLNMKNFLRYGREDSLVLIDEFGTGTEPMLGGAIAEAILAALNKAKVKGVITTHYTNLKHFAAETPGISNGAMLYDSHRMTPLFELKIGKPGSSFAFEIAKKIGLPKEILEEASSKIGEDHINYDRHLKDIARDKRYWEEKRRKIHENEKRLEEIIEKYDRELNETSRIRKEVIREAQEKAQEIISTANKTVENTIRGIKENQADKEKTRQLRQRMEEEKQRLLAEQQSEEDERIRRKMEKLQNREKNRKEKKKQAPSSPIPVTEPLQKGDYVTLPNHAIGEIIAINGKNAIVALGQLQTNVKTGDLKKASASQAKKAMRTPPPATYNSIQENISQKRLTFKPDIDLRGMRGEEALQRVTTFLDEAAMLNYKEVRLLHGTGTGALRQLIRQFLSTNPLVASYHDEQVQLGGAGITVVHLDL